MLLSVQIPAAIKHQGPQGSQRLTGLFTPMHALMLLPASDNQVIALFNRGTANVLAPGSALPVVGDESLAFLEVLDQLVKFLDILGLRSIGFQDVQSSLHLATPEVFDQQAQQFIFCFSSATDQAGQVGALLAAVIPIQKQD